MPSPSSIPTHSISAAVLQSEMGALGGAGWAETWWEGELEHFPLYSGFFFVPSLINSSPLSYNPTACLSSHKDGSLTYVPSCDFVISLSSRIVQSLFCTHLGLYLQTQIELYEANCPTHISSAWREAATSSWKWVPDFPFTMPVTTIQIQHKYRGDSVLVAVPLCYGTDEWQTAVIRKNYFYF